MRNWTSKRSFTDLQIGVAISLTVIAIFTIAFYLRQADSNWVITKFEKSARKTQLVQTMKSELLGSAEAEKNSVMAVTDEESEAFAELSMQASQSVEKARVEFKALAKEKSREASLLDEFSSCWERLRSVDKEVLSLAVQNTNLKALRLSFVPAAAAIRNMEESLNQLMDSVASAPNAAGITRFASDALTGALNIYALEAPHIAEATDTEMDRIEASMKQFDRHVRDAFNGLDIQVGDSGKPLVERARESYRDFQTVNAQVIGLSRQNSNIRSFAVSLSRKSSTMAQCLDRLNALQNAVHENSTFKATR